MNSFALCLCHSGQIFHYLLDMNTLGQLSIENGRKFENLLQVVDHYSRTPDGLLRALGEVCPVNIFSAAESESRVRHGPLRIDETEISVKGELGAAGLCALWAGCKGQGERARFHFCHTQAHLSFPVDFAMISLANCAWWSERCSCDVSVYTFPPAIPGVVAGTESESGMCRLLESLCCLKDKPKAFSPILIS